MVAGEAFDGAGIAAAGGVAQLLGLAAQLVEVGALGKRSGHGVSLLRLRSAAQAEEEATAIMVVLGGGLSPSRGPGGALQRHEQASPDATVIEGLREHRSPGPPRRRAGLVIGQPSLPS